MRHLCFFERRDEAAGWIQCQSVNAGIDTGIVGQRLLAHRIGQSFNFTEIQADVVGQTDKFKGQSRRVCQTHGGASRHLRQGDVIRQPGVPEPGVMFIGVVERVIAAVRAFSTKTDVQRRNAQMLKKWRIIRPGTQRADAQVAAPLQFITRL